MRVVIYKPQVPFAKPQHEWLNAFVYGLVGHGIQPRFAIYERPLVADVAVMYGLQGFDKIKNTGARPLIVEMGYVGDRSRYQSILWDGLNGRGFNPPPKDDGDRWNSQFGKIQVKPWKTDGEYVLMIGQYSVDQSVKHMDVRKWYEDAFEELEQFTSLPVRFKPHPLSDKLLLNPRLKPLHAPPDVPGLVVDRSPLEEHFERCAFAVTANSNAGVLAAIAGVPVVAIDEGAICWPVASHKIGEPLRRPDRKAWLDSLAWKQWLISEVERGDAWDYLRRAL